VAADFRKAVASRRMRSITSWQVWMSPWAVSSLSHSSRIRSSRAFKSSWSERRVNWRILRICHTFVTTNNSRVGSLRLRSRGPLRTGVPLLVEGREVQLLGFCVEREFESAGRTPVHHPRPRQGLGAIVMDQIATCGTAPRHRTVLSPVTVMATRVILALATVGLFAPLTLSDIYYGTNFW
jgi:hypothetical protein